MTNVMIISKILENEGFNNITTFTDPRKAINQIQESSEKTDLLILDIEMPYINGIQFLELLSIPQKNVTDRFPVIVISGTQSKETKYSALTAGATDFISKPIDPIDVALRVKNTLTLQLSLKSQANLALTLENQVAKRTRELALANESLVEMLALAGEMRDNETGNHVERVGRYVGKMASAIGLPPDLCFILEQSAPLHDVGKISIPDHILLKPGKLTADEFEIIKTHAQAGYSLLMSHSHDSEILRMAASIAISHHEKWDGTGYPQGLAGESIPLEGRITAICDVFDALTSARPYKNAWPIHQVVDYFREQAGKQFDPTLIQAFEKLIDVFTEIRAELAD